MKWKKTKHGCVDVLIFGGGDAKKKDLKKKKKELENELSLERLASFAEDNTPAPTYPLCPILLVWCCKYC